MKLSMWLFKIPVYYIPENWTQIGSDYEHINRPAHTAFLIRNNRLADDRYMEVSRLIFLIKNAVYDVTVLHPFSAELIILFLNASLI